METKAVKVDALVQSFNEPQLDRCLKSVRDQTYPYYVIININGVDGTCNGLARGITAVKSEWFSHIGGDCVLHKDALERVVKFMESYPHEKCFGYYLYLYDPFIESVCGFLGVVRTSKARELSFKNELVFDRMVMHEIRKDGWFIRKTGKSSPAGTHFENPDEYQVFHRFFILATKTGEGGYKQNREMLTSLYDKQKDNLHFVAIKALDFGWSKGPYGRSISDRYNREMYEEWKSTPLLSP